jgi:hypothetical protein
MFHKDGTFGLGATGGREREVIIGTTCELCGLVWMSGVLEAGKRLIWLLK